MKFNRSFRFGIILRVLFLTLTLIAFVFLLLETSLYFSIAILFLFISGQIIALIRYLEQTNILLTRFLDAIRYSDFTGSFQTPELGSNFDKLNESFTQVINRFNEERSKKVESIRYLETVVQHIGIGLICINGQGEIILMNGAAQHLFKIPAFKTLESLKQISETLFKTVKQLKGGNRTVTRVTIQNETLQLAIHATEFIMRDDHFKLVSFQNIHTELEEKEMEAWQNLTQVLAHEIMNSITPISSLSATVKMLLEENIDPNVDKVHLNHETVTDVTDALNTISNRSMGLIRFVNSYRDFTQIPEPRIERFRVKKFLLQTVKLMKAQADEYGIDIVIETEPESLELTADPHLTEQVLINLIKNAIHILSRQENGRIHLRGELSDSGKVVIKVSDNGPGIKKSSKEKVFIPFYTVSGESDTKSSGIGLSLSRQIMRLQKGRLLLETKIGTGSTFTMQF